MVCCASDDRAYECITCSIISPVLMLSSGFLDPTISAILLLQITRMLIGAILMNKFAE